MHKICKISICINKYGKVSDRDGGESVGAVADADSRFVFVNRTVNFFFSN